MNATENTPAKVSMLNALAYESDNKSFCQKAIKATKAKGYKVERYNWLSDIDYLHEVRIAILRYENGQDLTYDVYKLAETPDGDIRIKLIGSVEDFNQAIPFNLK